MVGSFLRLVTVDVTNTLIRVKGSPGKQYAFIGRKHGIDLKEDLLTGVFLKNYKDYSKKYPNFGAAVGMPANIWWSSLVKDCFQSLDPALKMETLDKIANELYFHYMTTEAWEFLPGAFNALKDLRQYPLKIGVISNWDHRLYRVLFAYNLRPFFDFVLPSYIVGVEKPDPRIFQQALVDANCKAHEAVHFGDNIEKDFNGARNIGMHAYLLASREKNIENLDKKFVVSSVQEFVDAIRPSLGQKSSEKGE